MQVGFTTLREFAVQRPPLRGNAMKVLLDLTTHSGLLSLRLRQTVLTNNIFPIFLPIYRESYAKRCHHYCEEMGTGHTTNE